jgi:amino acid permease
MNSFFITTQLSQQEYCKLFLQLSYKQRLYQIITMMGILLLILSIVRFFVPSFIPSGVQWFLLCFSIYVLVLFPVIVWLRAKRIYKISPGLQGTINYQFTENGVAIKGGDKESEFEWRDFARAQQTKSFLLLYNYNRAAYFIKLEDLTQEQMEFIKTKVEGLR